MVCEKHKDFEQVTGVPIAEGEGFIVTHFPIIEGQKANKGHLLIEAKHHIVDVTELSEAEAQSLGLLICKSITLLTKFLGAEHAYVFRINDKVAHFHFHVVPRYQNTPKEFWGHKITEWPDATKLDHDQVRSLSKELRLQI